MHLLEKVGTFMAALSKEGNAPQRENLLPVLQSIGVTTRDEALVFIGEIKSEETRNSLKERADEIHPQITGPMSAIEIAAIISSAVTTVMEIEHAPDVEEILKMYPQPKIV